ncbi:bud emergence protein 1, partial [Borealophlyctis nickersoniae]
TDALALAPTSRILSNPFIVQDGSTPRTSTTNPQHSRAATSDATLQSQSVASAVGSRDELAVIDESEGGSTPVGAEQPAVKPKEAVTGGGAPHARSSSLQPAATGRRAPAWQPQILPTAAAASATVRGGGSGGGGGGGAPKRSHTIQAASGAHKSVESLHAQQQQQESGEGKRNIAVTRQFWEGGAAAAAAAASPSTTGSGSAGGAATGGAKLGKGVGLASREGSVSDLTTLEEGDRGDKTGTYRASPDVNKPVRRARVLEVVRQSSGKSSNQYVYLIQVHHIGDPPTHSSLIRHTYEDFFDFHLRLLGHFPQEAGLRVGLGLHDTTVPAQKRIIPELPGQMMFVSEAVAKNRVGGLQNYIESILALPPKISRSPLVMHFFRVDGKNATGGGGGGGMGMGGSRSSSYSSRLSELAQ